jgi:hypothetical protein
MVIGAAGLVLARGFRGFFSGLFLPIKACQGIIPGKSAAIRARKRQDLATSSPADCGNRAS